MIVILILKVAFHIPTPSSMIKHEHGELFSEEIHWSEDPSKNKLGDTVPAVVFVHPVDSLFHCSICKFVANDPRSCGNAEECSAVFCSTCLTHYSSRVSKQCFSCKLKMKTKIARNLIIRKLILDLLVHCPICLSDTAGGVVSGNEREDSSRKRCASSLYKCDWQGKLSDLNDHITKSCPSVIVRCGFPGCSASMIRYDAAHHQENCTYKYVTCIHCEKKIEYTMMDQHIEHDCMLIPVACPYENCCVKVPKQDIEQHKVACVHRLVECEHCRLQIKSAELDSHVEKDCPQKLITCECALSVPRCMIADHINGACPLTMISCMYSEHGCNVLCARKEMAQHLADDSRSHNLLTLTALQDLKSRMVGAEDDLDLIQEKLRQLENKVFFTQITWTIKGMGKKLEEAAGVQASKAHFSSDFFIHEGSGGSSRLVLSIDLQDKRMGLYIRKKSAPHSATDNPFPLSGSMLSLQGQGKGAAALSDRSIAFKDGSEILAGSGLGFSKFVGDVTPYISQDRIVVNAKIALNYAGPLQLTDLV